jgi:ABC-type transporter Mla subunit MlaD
VAAPGPLWVDFDQRDVLHLDDFEDLQSGVVEDRLHMMDDFVKHEFEEEAKLQDSAAVPSNTPSAPVVVGDAHFAPKFAYAFSEGEAVSVLMRVDHLRISDELAKVGMEALAPMSATPSSRLTGLDVAAPVAELSASSSGVVARQVKASEVKSPKLDQFSAKCAELSTTIAKAKANIGRISAATKQLDALFASVAPEAGQFGEHLVSMLAQLDPSFKSSTNMLALPIKYRPALTVNLAAILKSAGAPASVTNQISDMFKNIDKANNAIKGVRVLLDKIGTQSKNASASYKAFFTQSIQIASPSLFPQTLGRSVTNLSGLVEALQARLDQVTSNFDTLARVGKSLVENPGQLVDPTATFTNLDEQYSKLVPLVDVTIAQAQKLSPLVDSLYAALADAHKVVQTTHNATKTAMQICRKAEAQVVSADVFRGLCARLHSAVAPFETFLAQLQAQATPTSPVPTQRSAVSTSPQAATISPPVSQTKTPVPTPSPQSAAAVKKANDSLGGAPFDIVTSLIGPKIFEAMNKNLDAFAKIKEFDEELAKLTSLQQTVAKNGLDKFRSAIANLVKAVEPKDASALASAAAADTVNSLLDQAGAQSLADIMKTIETISEKAVNKPV